MNCRLPIWVFVLNTLSYFTIYVNIPVNFYNFPATLSAVLYNESRRRSTDKEGIQ